MNTDWWMFGASLSSGILTAIATLIAVIISNKETRKQLKEQQEQHMMELKEQNKANKFVVIKPIIILSTFVELLDKIVMQNNYNRELLLSGEDGFDFFDDGEKKQRQICRILHIENTSNNNITDIILLTNSCLEDRNTNKLKKYQTKNVVKLLRARESIDIRLANQEQYESIIKMNKEKTPNEFKFESIIEYSTEAGQRVTYCYKMKISNDRCVEIEKDGIDKIEDCEKKEDNKATVFRNLQDYITIDRSAYIWEKIGKSQARGALTLVNPLAIQQGNTLTNSEEEKSK